MAAQTIRAKCVALQPVMDERVTRLWAGAEAGAVGEGGIAIVGRATGLSRTTVRAGRDELRAGVTADDVVAVRRGSPRRDPCAPPTSTYAKLPPDEARGASLSNRRVKRGAC